MSDETAELARRVDELSQDLEEIRKMASLLCGFIAEMIINPEGVRTPEARRLAGILKDMLPAHYFTSVPQDAGREIDDIS